MGAGNAVRVQHWFGFKDCSLAVSEVYSARAAGDPRESRALFFLHGRFGHSHIWNPLVEALSSHFRCFQVDLPGFGGSYSVGGREPSLLEQAQMLGVLIKQLAPGQRRAILVGQDVGGAIVQLCAIQASESVAALVLMNSAGLTQPPWGLESGILCLRVRRRLQTLLAHLIADSVLAHRQLILEAWKDRASRRALVRAFAAWRYTWPGHEERRVWKRELSRLSCPVLLLWGSCDPINPPGGAEELLRQFPDAYLFERESCGHWPCLEATEWVETKIKEFLFQVSQSPAVRRSIA